MGIRLEDFESDLDIIKPLFIEKQMQKAAKNLNFLDLQMKKSSNPKGSLKLAKCCLYLIM